MQRAPSASSLIGGTGEGRSAASLIGRRSPAQPIGFHVTMRLEDDRPIATTQAAFRTVARVMLSQGEARGLLAFAAADNHLHAELATDRATAGAFAKYVHTALRWQLTLAARFEPARIRPLVDQKHAYNAFQYIHRQDARHGLDFDRAREGTSLPDLLGLRLLDRSLGARVRTHLPRVRPEVLASLLPAGLFEQSLAVDLDVLAESAAAVLALPDLSGRSPAATRARCAAVQAAGRTVPAEQLAECLGIGVRAVQVIRTRPSDPLFVRAVERQALLRKLTTTAASPNPGGG